MRRLSIFSSFDLPLMISAGILVTLSLVTLFSVDFISFRSQFLFLFVCLAAFFFASQLNYSVLRNYSLHIYILSIILLTAVLLFGSEARGSVRWFTIFGVGIQFSELLKPFLALSLAAYLTDNNDYSFKSFLKSLVLLAPIAFLIFMQPDLGNALIYVFVVGGALLIFGYPLKWFAAGFVLWLALLPVFWMFLHDYQRNRLLTFINPSSDPLGTSYNAIQAVIAVGSGMLTGRGFGQGTQSGLSFLPERHTDFIFATMAEQLGFIGSFILIVAFGFLFYRIFLMILDSEDKFPKMFSIIALLTIAVHFFVNVGMNLGLVPIVGVTLPFVSYGGSSLLSNFILLGFLFAVNKRSRRQTLEIK